MKSKNIVALALTLALNFQSTSLVCLAEESSAPQSSTPAVNQAPNSPLMESMSSELKRSFDKLKSHGDAPLYYLGYRLYDTTTVTISGEYGALTQEVEPVRSRYLSVDVRVGTPELDNTHKIREQGYMSSMGSSSFRKDVNIPIEDNDLALRQALWQQTDQSYKEAQQQFSRVVANRDINVTEDDPSNDFSKEDKAEYFEQSQKFDLDSDKKIDEWTQRVKRLSAIYRRYPSIYDSSVVFQAKLTRRYLVNSEGTRIEDSRTDYRIYTTAQARADDGMDLWLYDDFEAVKLDEMPQEESLDMMVTKVADNLVKLEKAPKAQPFAGPAILRSKAAGVFFHEVFGHRMEGHRQKDEKEGRTFTKSIGRQIMPSFISVVDDPTLERLGNVTLNGYYKYDDEGVPAQKTALVENGVLKSFLLGRSPIENFPKSNGHGRCALDETPVSRMGNLMIQSEKCVPYDELRQMLISEIKRQKKDYGLIFDDIAGGFTVTQSQAPQVYSLKPLIVTKVFADGRPDELVRGVKIVGTPLTALEKIICAADDNGTFNGVCGAESGSVPVSASSPSLLVGSLEVELKDKRQDKPPLLPPPYHDKDKAEEHKSSGGKS